MKITFFISSRHSGSNVHDVHSGPSVSDGLYETNAASAVLTLYLSPY